MTRPAQTGQGAGSALDDIAAQVAQGTADLVVSAATWWVTTDSVDPRDTAVLAAQAATRPLILIILVGSVLTQSIRLIVSRRGEPAMLVAVGLLRYAAVSALGLITLQTALRAGDALAVDLLDDAAGNFAQLMARVLTDGGNAFLVLLASLIAAVLSLVQWVLMAMRQAGILVLAAMLPLAASGSLNRATRGWFDRALVWLVAMVAYKPAAAFVYYIGFSYLSSPATSVGGSVSVMLTGLMVLILAIIALPLLLRFFAWSGTQVGGGNGGGSGLLGAAGAVAMTQAYGRGAGLDRAAALALTGPGSRPTAGTYSPATPTGAAPAAASVAGAAAVGTAAVSTAAAGAEAVKRTGAAMTDPPEETK